MLASGPGAATGFAKNTMDAAQEAGAAPRDRDAAGMGYHLPSLVYVPPIRQRRRGTARAAVLPGQQWSADHAGSLQKGKAMKQSKALRSACLALGIGLAGAAGAMLTPGTALAQAGGMGGMGESAVATARAVVKAIDLAKRQVTLVGPQGNVFVVHASEAVQNLDQVKVGDTVVARYFASVVLVLSAPGTPIPSDQMTSAMAHAPKGQMPAGAVGDRIVVTGTVVAVDPVGHTISLVDPAGGLVRSFTVTDPRRQAALKRVKVGDTLTAIVTEALAVALSPA